MKYQVRDGKWFLRLSGEDHWFCMGPSTEEYLNVFGYSSGITVEEAISLDIFDPDLETGTPRVSVLS